MVGQVVGVGTNETVQYYNGTVNGILLHYYLILNLTKF